MAYINDISLYPNALEAAAVGSVKSLLNRILWSFYEEFGETSYPVKVWFISVSIKVKHLRPLFVAIVGEPLSEPN